MSGAIRLGNLAEWASAAFAGAAFLVTYLLLRTEIVNRKADDAARKADEADRRGAQARAVAWTTRTLAVELSESQGMAAPEPHVRFRFAITNGSRELITNVRVAMWSGLGYVSGVKLHTIAPQDEWMSGDELIQGEHLHDVVGWLEFTDSRGVLWRLSHTGELTEPEKPMMWPPVDLTAQPPAPPTS